MRIDLTVRDPTGAQTDIAVVSRLPVRLGDLRDHLPALASSEIWSGHRCLSDDAMVGGDGLRAGALLVDRWRPEVTTSTARVQVVGGPDAGRTCELSSGAVSVGRAPDNALVLTDPDVSRRHATISVLGRRVGVRDAGSTNGTSIEGRALGTDQHEVAPGELIRIGDTYLDVVLADRAQANPSSVAVQPSHTGTLLVNRAPRMDPPLTTHEVVVHERSTERRPVGVRLIGAVVPAAAGIVLAVVLHSPQYLLFAALSPLTMIATAFGDRLRWRRERRRAADDFRGKDTAARAAIAAGLLTETRATRERYPDPVSVRRIATLHGSRLWQRARRDDDFLSVRVGLGVATSALRTRTGADVRSAGLLRDVPLVTDLRAGPIGIVGPAAVRSGLARWIAVQLAVLHSPADVQLGLLLSGEGTDAWRWARWLPHLHGASAVSPAECPEYLSGLVELSERRRSATRPGQAWRGPWLVLVLDRAGGLAAMPGLAGLLSSGASIGITAICLDGTAEQLPKACATIVTTEGDAGTRVRVAPLGQASTRDAVADRVDGAWCDSVARALAPLVDAAADPAAVIPESCRLTDVLQLDPIGSAAIVSRWARSDGQPATALGVGADGPWTLDLVRDGPHALIAGTTGAGKSELLQSLIVGLAAEHPPDEIAFVLVDYKGGAAFGECARLPHTVGLVTDLDAHLTARALTSLDAELRRREQLFAAVNASDLDEYRQQPGVEALARLVIVIDEFASLAEELPAFVTGLVGVAQRGRSLGVHLVLATQRPAGVVSADIRANTALRIALRVTDATESVDVIDTDLAAALSRRSPGRAYVRVGTLLKQVQVASVCTPAATAAVTAPFQVELLDSWRRIPRTAQAPDSGTTDLQLLVGAVREAAHLTNRPSPRRPWLAPLPAVLSLGALGTDDACAAVVRIGLADHPSMQAQRPVLWDLDAGGSLLLIGAPGTGRRTALITLACAAAARRVPDQLHVHAIDFDAGLRELDGLPHCGTIAGPGQIELAVALITRLEAEFAGRGSSRTHEDGPAQLLLLDGWESFVAAADEFDGGRTVDRFLTLLRLAPGSSLSVAVSCGRAGLAPRLGAAFGTRFVFAMTDRADYAMAGLDPRTVPQNLPSGRAVRVGDGVEMQFAHAGTEPTAAATNSHIATLMHRHASAARSAMRLRPLPRSVNVSDLADPPPGHVVLGVGGDFAAPIAVDLFAGAGRLLVSGPPRAGRTSLLRSLLVQARASGVAAIVAAAARSRLALDATELGVSLLTPGDATSLLDLHIRNADRPLLLVDDVELFLDTAIGDAVAALAGSHPALALVASGRTDDLILTYRGIGAEVRRARCCVLLQPGPGDGELVGTRLPRHRPVRTPGRGLLFADAAWTTVAGPTGDGLPIQVAL